MSLSHYVVAELHTWAEHYSGQIASLESEIGWKKVLSCFIKKHTLNIGGELVSPGRLSGHLQETSCRRTLMENAQEDNAAILLQSSIEPSKWDSKFDCATAIVRYLHWAAL